MLYFHRWQGTFSKREIRQNRTNIVKIKEVLGDHMCVTGDMPPAILELGTPDDNYNYARKLIDLFGKSGFIMSSGCSVPPHAPLENIKAVIAATLEG